MKPKSLSVSCDPPIKMFPKSPFQMGGPIETNKEVVKQLAHTKMRF